MNTELFSNSARAEFASLLRALYVGRITNDEFDERASVLAGKDFAVDQIYRFGAWPTYDDTRTYKLMGKDALSPEGKRIVARWILFLKSKFVYRWPAVPHLPTWAICFLIFLPLPCAYFIGKWILATIGFPLAILTDNLYRRARLSSWEKAGNSDFWPFLSKSEYEEALGKPSYLIGPSTSTAS